MIQTIHALKCFNTYWSLGKHSNYFIEFGFAATRYKSWITNTESDWQFLLEVFIYTNQGATR